MQNQAGFRRFARQPARALDASAPDSIAELALYLGITPETLSQLAALHHLRRRRAAHRDQGIMQAPGAPSGRPEDSDKRAGV